jgi:hypothetical protein
LEKGGKMPRRKKRQKAALQSTALARATKTGKVCGQEGFVVRLSESGMANVPGLKDYAKEFGIRSAKDRKSGFPQKAKGEGIIPHSTIIITRDPFTQEPISTRVTPTNSQYSHRNSEPTNCPLLQLTKQQKTNNQHQAHLHYYPLIVSTNHG